MVIKTNEYFSGNVKSLGSELHGQTFTVGIINPGEYTFGTQTEEYMEIVYGEMNVSLPNGSKKKFQKGDHFIVPANQSFTVTATAPVSYICLYK